MFLDSFLKWIFSTSEEPPPKSDQIKRQETDAELLFEKRTIELKLTHDERNRLRKGVESISQRVKAPNAHE